MIGVRLNKNKIVFISLLLVLGAFLLYSCGQGGGGGVVVDPIPDGSVEVTSIIPVDNATGVAINTTIQVQFNRTMDASSINEHSFIVQTSTGEAKRGQITYNSATKTAIFTPTGNFSYSTGYEVILNTQIKDKYNQRLASTFEASFQTGAFVDTTPPSVAQTYPQDGASAIPYAASITVTFDEPISLASVSMEVQRSGGAAVSGTLSYNASTNTVTFAHAQPFAFDADYDASIIASDTSGNRMAASYEFSFSAKGWEEGTLDSSGTHPKIVDDGEALTAAYYSAYGVNGILPLSGLYYKEMAYGSSWGTKVIIDQIDDVNVPGVDTDMMVDSEGNIHLALRDGCHEEGEDVNYNYYTPEYKVFTGMRAAGDNNYEIPGSVAITSMSEHVFVILYDTFTTEAGTEYLYLVSLGPEDEEFSDREEIFATSSKHDRAVGIDAGLDSNMTLYVCYRDDDTGNLALSHKPVVPGTWSKSDLDNTGTVGTSCAMAIDDDLNVFVAYNSSSASGSLWLAKYNAEGGGLQGKYSCATDGAYGPLSMCLANDTLYIVFFNQTTKNLDIVYASTDDLSDWGFVTIKNIGAAGVQHISMAVPEISGEYRPHIVYESNGAIYYVNLE